MALHNIHKRPSPSKAMKGADVLGTELVEHLMKIAPKQTKRLVLLVGGNPSIQTRNKILRSFSSFRSCMIGELHSFKLESPSYCINCKECDKLGYNINVTLERLDMLYRDKKNGIYNGKYSISRLRYGRKVTGEACFVATDRDVSGLMAYLIKDLECLINHANLKHPKFPDFTTGQMHTALAKEIMESNTK